MTRTLLVAFALILSGFAETNFSGTWKLNVAKSDFGMVPPTDSRTDVIEQSGGHLKDTVAQNGQQGAMNYAMDVKTDGTEVAAKFGPRDVKISAAWAGPALAVTTKLDFDGNDVLIKSNWTLSADGNTWTQTSHITSPMGETDTTLVFDKQSGNTIPPAPAVTATAPATSAMGAKPNLSGVWKLNVDKSDFGPIPGPESEVDTIDHKEPVLNLAVAQQGAQGKQNYQLAININGQEEAHKLGDRDVKTTAQWEGSALIVLTKLMFQDNEVLIKAAYTMAPDGKTVNVATHLSSAMGEADQKMVFEKQ
ncbi:MAG: hypothetical protein ABSH09_14365 [Bryobacteraceae bacterium]